MFFNNQESFFLRLFFLSKCRLNSPKIQASVKVAWCLTSLLAVNTVYFNCFCLLLKYSIIELNFYYLKKYGNKAKSFSVKNILVFFVFYNCFVYVLWCLCLSFLLYY